MGKVPFCRFCGIMAEEAFITVYNLQIRYVLAGDHRCAPTEESKFTSLNKTNQKPSPAKNEKSAPYIDDGEGGLPRGKTEEGGRGAHRKTVIYTHKNKKSFSCENDFFIGVIWIIAQIKA